VRKQQRREHLRDAGIAVNDKAQALEKFRGTRHAGVGESFHQRLCGAVRRDAHTEERPRGLCAAPDAIVKDVRVNVTCG